MLEQQNTKLLKVVTVSYTHLDVYKRQVTYWVKCDCGKELTHSMDYKDYESYYNSNDYSVKILINQLLDEGHCAGNEEVCGASHYRYGTNENWIKG